MSVRLQNRRAIVSALDSLLGWGSDEKWVGGLQEIRNEIKRQGYWVPGDYLIKKVVLEHGGEWLFRGRYRITRKKFMEE